MDIRGAWLVAGRVAEHLDLRRQASKVTLRDEAPTSEAGRREHPVVAVRHPIDAVPAVIEPHGMDVDLAPLRVAQDEIGIGCALDQSEAVVYEDQAHPRHVADTHDEVQIVMRSRLLPNEGVDTPSSLDPGLDPRVFEAIDDASDVVGGQHGRGIMTPRGRQACAP